MALKNKIKRAFVIFSPTLFLQLSFRPEVKGPEVDMLVEKIQHLFYETRTENSTVYLEQVPEVDTLSPIGKYAHVPPIKITAEELMDDTMVNSYKSTLDKLIWGLNDNSNKWWT